MRSTWAEIDLSAVTHNVGLLRDAVAPAEVCAVVKADGYGHGAVAVGRAALDGGATCLAVALVEEGRELRAAGIEVPVLVLSEPQPAEAAAVVQLDLQPTVYTEVGITALADAASTSRDEPLLVHLKVDTGMHRVGVQPSDMVATAKAIVARPELTLASVWTHLAVADEVGNPFTDEQLRRYREALRSLESAGIDVPCRHAANSAAALAHPESRFDLVRCGIAAYGIDPVPVLHGIVELRPALRLVSRVAMVKEVEAGEALSYGQRYRLDRRSVVATVPVGYADGVRRQLSSVGGEVLIGGRRRPIAGTVTMDQITVDCATDDWVRCGDEVVLIGGQGDEEITVAEWADRLDTIGYEIVCGIGPRVPRRPMDGTEPEEEQT